MITDLALRGSRLPCKASRPGPVLSGVSGISGAGVIRDLLSAYPPSAKVFARRAYCGSWNLLGLGVRRCAFHVVEGGSCTLERKRAEPLELGAGDLVLFPRGAWHNLAGNVTCGYFEFADTRSNPILDALPEIVIVRAQGEADRLRIANLVGLLGAEADAGAAGNAIVLDKLAEVLFAMVLRAHLEAPEEKRGFLGALSDARLARALAAIHREPDRSWQVESLAAEAGMSRSAFSLLFTELVGQPPMHYVGEWRMRRAEALLHDRRNSVYAVAAQFGYRTEAAFRRAFKRFTGRSPGEVRRPT